MIVKVQLSIYDSSSLARKVLVYDEKRTFSFEGECPPDILMLMGQRPKAFFHATIDSQKRISLGQEAGWQSW